MPAVPHPCFDPLAFYLDTGDSKVHLRAKPAGGLVIDADGVSVDFPAIVPLHLAFDRESLVIAGPFADGIVNPTGPDVLTLLISGPSITNPFGREAFLEIHGSANLVLLPPEDLSACLIHVDVTFDAITYQRMFTTGYFSDAGSTRAGFYSRHERTSLFLAAGQTVTPAFIAYYENVGADADFIQANNIAYDWTIHTI